MPTPSVIRDLVRQRTSIAISLGEAIRVARAAAGRTLTAELEIQGRDVRTGQPAAAVLSVRDLLTAPARTAGRTVRPSASDPRSRDQQVKSMEV